VLQTLNTRFSISTAEELISADAMAGSKLRAHLHIEQTTWNSLLEAARRVFSTDELCRLTTRMAARAGGAKMRAITPEQLRKHASGITFE
jgi:hypothetical protein